MKNKKNKITNLLKIGILFFGVSLLLWNCEKDEFTSNPNQSNLLSKLQSEFNAESFKKAIPYEFEVLWNNENKKYHKELEKYYYEFPINFTNSFNPNNFKTKNVSKYSTIYKVFVVENENQEHSFYIYKSYTENINKKKLKEKNILFEEEISNGLNHILNNEGEIVYAEKIENGKKDENIFFNKEFKKKKTKENYQSRMLQDCYTVTTYHYTDNYIKFGNGPYTYVSTTFNGTSTETICESYWLPDLNIGGGGNSGGYYTNPGNSPAYQDCQSNSNKNYQGRYVEESNPCKYVISVNPIECGEGYVYDPVLNTCVEEEDGPSCKSFNYVNTTPTWQEAAVVDIDFHVYLFDGSGLKYLYTQYYGQPVLFGAPSNLTNGGNVSAGLAAEISANALRDAIRSTIQKFTNKYVNETEVDIYFKNKLKEEFDAHYPGGRVQFNSTTNLQPTQYKTFGILPDDCN